MRHAQVGLEMLVSHPGNDPNTWAVTQIFYNGQLYQNTTQLNTAFADTTSGLNRQQVTSTPPETTLLNVTWACCTCPTAAAFLASRCRFQAAEDHQWFLRLRTCCKIYIPLVRP